MVIHMHAKYTFGNPNVPNYTPFGIHKIHLCIHEVATKLVKFTTNET